MVRANYIRFIPIDGFFIRKPVKKTHQCRTYYSPVPAKAVHIAITAGIKRKKLKKRPK